MNETFDGNGDSKRRVDLRLYCATCEEYLSGRALDADDVVIVIHAMGGHRLVLKPRGK